MADSDQERASSQPGNPSHGSSTAKRKVPPGSLPSGNPPRDWPDAQYSQPVKVDGTNRRSDDDALEGHFCRITKGKHAGALGVFDFVEEYGRDGYPTKVNVQLRDATGERVSVPYANLRPEPQARRGA